MIGHCAPVVKANARLPFQFHALPCAIIADGLPSTAAILFAILIDESKRRGWRTRLTNAALAARLGRTPRTIKRLLAILESHGLIARELAADGRIRTGIKIIWDGVGHSRTVNARTEGRENPAGGKPEPLKVGHSDLPSSERPQSAFQTGEVSTSREEKTESSPPLSAEGIAAAIAEGMRQVVGGEHAAMIFDVEPSTPTASTSTPSTTPTAKPATTPTTPATKTTAPYNGLDLRRVGVSAVAACFSPAFGAVRNTPEKLNRQVAELRARSRGPSPTRGNPSPAPPLDGGPSSAKSTDSAQIRSSG